MANTTIIVCKIDERSMKITLAVEVANMEEAYIFAEDLIHQVYNSIGIASDEDPRFIEDIQEILKIHRYYFMHKGDPGKATAIQIVEMEH